MFTRPRISGPRPAPDLTDLLVALSCLVVFSGPVLIGLDAGRGPWWAIAGFAIADTAPLVFRRWAPVPVLAAVAAVELAALLTGVRFTFLVSNAGLAIAVAVFTVAAWLARRRALVASVVVIAVLGAGGLLALRWYPDQDQNFVQLVIALPAYLLGDAVRGRRETRRELAEQTARARSEREARIRAEERVRVSRDVHDIVSHTLSMIAVRAGAGRMLADADPDQARQAFAAIEQGSRSALIELRRVLRSTREPAIGPDAVGTPTLADLDVLLNGVRAGGIEVVVSSTGTGNGLPPLLETTGYRLIQEALTNVVKHAAADRVQVTMVRTEQRLRIEVTDNGRGVQSVRDPQAAGGFGLTGMRERVELWGGTLVAESLAGGGFSVRAELPLVAPTPVGGRR
ncbi:sensor histidine kinase [Nakamurella lactea]|uniref:sensor histidine kinase n=1 Tax=Nakamurella lactea TaxID=459515 RepID=UPI0003FE15FF|nr:sensor histidine kinase [Nakamurella lactea]